MRCRACKKEIPDGSLYCNHCGERQVKERKKKTEVSVPEPKQMPSGAWFVRLMVKGERMFISAPTAAECSAKAKAAKLGLIAVSKAPARMTLRQACEAYIAQCDNVIAPSTVRGYVTYQNNRFQTYMDKDIREINYQEMVNREAPRVSAKYLKNCWSFVASALKAQGVEPGNITLKPVPQRELAFIPREQIGAFMAMLKGSKYEMFALFGMHGLRRSEIYALTPSCISGNVIDISRAMVFDRNNNLVEKDTNKTPDSTRQVTIKIPRLMELIEASPNGPDEPYYTGSINTPTEAIKKLCKANGLPPVGMHGLRRSFASLAYSLGWSSLATMKEGGWKDKATMDRKYIKLSDADARKQGDSMTDFYKELQIASDFASASEK